jgi:hypothetical protein
LLKSDRLHFFFRLSFRVSVRRIRVAVTSVVINMQLNITSNLNEIITRLSDYPSAVERIASRSIKRALISGRSQAISSIFKYFGLREGTIRSAAGEPMMHGKMSGSVDFNGPRIKWSDFLKSGDQYFPKSFERKSRHSASNDGASTLDACAWRERSLQSFRSYSGRDERYYAEAHGTRDKQISQRPTDQARVELVGSLICR